MTDVDETRFPTDQEVAHLRRVLAEEDRAWTALDAVLERRDALLHGLRWGTAGLVPVAPEALRRATVCARYPNGISRTTFYRAVGRTKDRPASAGRTTDGE